MRFELQSVTEVTFTNANVRGEFHGEEHVRAVDIAMKIQGENTLLDLIEPGLREHHFKNNALLAGQEALPDVVIPLPNLRHPELPAKIAYAKGKKWRGYRFVLDYGLGGDSNLDFTDCVLTGIWYELTEGGSVEIGFTIQYNGEELNDDEVYGRLAGLATRGKGHVQIIAPPLLTLVKGKGYRSGKPDTQQASADDGGSLLDGEGEDGGEEEGEELDPESPEGAFVAAAG